MPLPLIFNESLGQGEPLILIHGLFGSSDNLLRIAKELAQDYEVIRVDQRNHGNSFHSDDMNYELMVEDVLKVMDKHKIESAHFIGHSMGGKTAMALALRHPHRVKKLIVADIAPVTYPPHHKEILSGLCSLPLDKVQSRKSADEFLAQHVENTGVRQFLLKSLLISAGETAKWKFNLSSILSNYEAILAGENSQASFLGKTLFIAGGNSDYIKPEYRDKTMELFPNAVLKIIPETSHWLHAEKPRIFVGICQRFLNNG